MLKRIKLLNSAGDTIIEVMIVLAVLGLSIGIAYATANHSLINARQAQENTQATEIIQGQAEALRSMAANVSSSSDYIFRAGTFCVGSDGHITTSSCQLGEASRYTIAVKWGGAPADLFSIKATWVDASGQGNATNTLFYRIHVPAASAPTGGGMGGGGGVLYPNLAASGCSGPIGAGWTGSACESGDSIAVIVNAIKAGDSCVLKADNGDNSGPTVATFTASGTACTGNFNFNKFGSSPKDNLTAYVTDAGNVYTSNSLSFVSWANTPTHYACSWPGHDHAYGGVDYSNWYFTLNSDTCLSGTTCYNSPACGTYAPTFNGYQNFDIACWTGSAYVYGSTWNGHDDTAQPCPPGTVRAGGSP